MALLPFDRLVLSLVLSNPSCPSALLYLTIPCSPHLSHHPSIYLTNPSSVVQHDLLPSTLQSSLSPLDDPATTPTPLFIHSNLLKHLNGFGIPRGSLFTHLKRIRPPHDVYDNPALDYAHSYVYIGNRGMCLDLEWHEAANENPGLREGAEVEIVDLRGVGEETVAEGLEGFEDSFWELGGRIGGW